LSDRLSVLLSMLACTGGAVAILAAALAPPADAREVAVWLPPWASGRTILELLDTDMSLAASPLAGAVHIVHSDRADLVARLGARGARLVTRAGGLPLCGTRDVAIQQRTTK